MSTLCPAAVLTQASPQGAAIFVPNGQIQDMTEPTLIHGWLDGIVLAGALDIDAPVIAYLFVGLRVIPEPLISIAETPMPFEQGDGDWLYHRVFPLFKGDQSVFPGIDGHYPGLSTARWHDEVKSARKLHEDEKVVFCYEIECETASAQISILANFRYLLRQP